MGGGGDNAIDTPVFLCVFLCVCGLCDVCGRVRNVVGALWLYARGDAGVGKGEQQRERSH